MSSVLGIVFRAISGHLHESAVFTRAQAQTGAVTLIQQSGGALNLNLHYHMIFLDGVYMTRPGGGQRFVKTEAPTLGELTVLVQRIATTRLFIAYTENAPRRRCSCSIPGNLQ